MTALSASGDGLVEIRQRGRLFSLGEGKPGIRFYERFRVKEPPQRHLLRGPGADDPGGQHRVVFRRRNFSRPLAACADASTKDAPNPENPKPKSSIVTSRRSNAASTGTGAIDPWMNGPSMPTRRAGRPLVRIHWTLSEMLRRAFRINRMRTHPAGFPIMTIIHTDRRVRGKES
ncbi:MAG: hypothetical protein BECKG1743D_GA0114223_101381 [Candidatus Kentron sp. G]|nr:MAG: hypothetical protein BECKG1743D_GA0114223_101381 [Candidatus Kentron sp. G]VFN07011.1 MAG: hypothetical protein BECKG1743E_GA0114224_111111 [Candidatus Kentron sp. G]